MKHKEIALSLAFMASFAMAAPAQTPAPVDESGTSYDLFIMFGSDLVRPGLLPKAN